MTHDPLAEASRKSGVAATCDERIQAHQAVRLRRLWMTIGSYCFTFSIVVLSAIQGFVDFIHVGMFFVLASIVNALFYCAFRTRWNLKRKDANLTFEQMVLSLFPALWVMYFVNDAQVRTSFLLIAIVPLLYGILGLDTRRFIWIGIICFLLMTGLLGLVVANRPEEVNLYSESIVLMALLAVMVQIALIGGYISSLREKLRARNEDLNDALSKIGRMANQDELTGVHNRRFLLHVIEQESCRCLRGAGAFSLCILDIDHFKRINDTYGHPAGDEVLRKVANGLEKGVRKIDCFGRYGGEEFLLIMPQTSIDGARYKAEQLRMAVERLTFPEIKEKFRVTVSIGVTQYRREEPLSDTIARADQALYQAKASGRNRVVCAENLKLPA